MRITRRKEDDISLLCGKKKLRMFNFISPFLLNDLNPFKTNDQITLFPIVATEKTSCELSEKKEE